MGNLELNPAYQALIDRNQVLAQHRSLSRYGSRESITRLPPNAGHWFALRCQGNTERLALEALKERNFEAYLPIIWVKQRRGRAMQERRKPMFSTYLFIRCLPISDHWDLARNAAGTRTSMQFVGENGSPMPVPPAQIDITRRVEAELATRTGRKALRWPFQIGDNVSVVAGPFASFAAKLISAVDDHGRIMALVDIFSQRVRVQFDADQLEKPECRMIPTFESAKA